MKNDLTRGSVSKGILYFAVPLFLGQLLQQLYNLADSWVIGNFAGNDSFAAVSSSGNITFLIIGFFNGVAIGGGVVISRYFGAKEWKKVEEAIHANFLFALLASVLATAAGLILMPKILVWIDTPDSVLPYANTYLGIYFGGVSTIILYNICMSIMRSLGDSLHPLYYLILSSCVNVGLDLLFVAGFHWDVAGAGIATVISQGISALLCIIRMCRLKDGTGLDFRKLKWNPKLTGEILYQGLPTGIQNSVISIGNIMVQSGVNSFGAFAMSGKGAYSKIEGFVFLPIMAMSMTLPTFIGQNLGAKEYGRAKKGAAFGILAGMVLAELVGILFVLFGRSLLGIFLDEEEAISFGLVDVMTLAPCYFLLAFSHCSAGVMRGCGKSMVPMVTMLSCWCAFRIVYVPTALKIFPGYRTISLVYPITWTLSSIVFIYFIFRTDWVHAFERGEKRV